VAICLNFHDLLNFLRVHVRAKFAKAYMLAFTNSLAE